MRRIVGFGALVSLATTLIVASIILFNQYLSASSTNGEMCELSQCDPIPLYYWDQARQHEGEPAWVSGTVKSIGRDCKGDVFLDLGYRFPDERRFKIFIGSQYVAELERSIPGFPHSLEYKTVGVFGWINFYNGVPEIALSSSMNLCVVLTPEARYARRSTSSQSQIPFAIEFWGATGEVAGSCYLVRVGEEEILIDCGSFMSKDPTADISSHHDNYPFPFKPSEIDALLVTHAHDDHTGRIHYLVYDGFSGPIYMTEASADIFNAKLQDQVHYCCLIKCAGQAENVETAIRDALYPVTYNLPIQVTDHVSATFVDAGHIPGSASIVLAVSFPDGSQHTVTFSGDIGSGHHPFLKGPDLDFLSSTDTELLVVESTYGYREPRSYPPNLYEELWNAIRESRDRYGSEGLVIIPTFALDRTQRLLAAIGEGMKEGTLPSDLKLAVGGKSSCYLTNVYVCFQQSRERYEEYFSPAFWADRPLANQFWEFLRGDSCCEQTAEDVERAKQFDVIVTPSGTGDSSFAKKLLKRYVSDPTVTIIKVGWTPPSSPLGQLENQVDSIEIDGESYQVQAEIIDLHNIFSGHADINMLLAYIGAFPNLKTVVITHGSDVLGARRALAERIHERWPDLEVVIPTFGSAVPLLQG